MNNICKNCHFLTKELREGGSGRAHLFSLSNEEREAIVKSPLDAIPSIYALNCHEGVWDEGISGSKEDRAKIINLTPRNNCFFFPHHPGMLFPTARKLQATTKVQNKMEKELELPDLDKITLSWLVHNLPLKLWISAIGVVIFVFVFGVQIGQISVVREFLGNPAPHAVIEPTVLNERIDHLTEGYNKNIAQITAQILSEEHAAGMTFYTSEQQPHIEAAGRLHKLLESEHKKYREAVNELRALQNTNN